MLTLEGYTMKRVLKNSRVALVGELDLRSTGGPCMPQGSLGKVVIVRRTGELWVLMDQFGHMHLSPTDVCLVMINPIDLE
jgi:hypothetical protein